MPLKDIEAARQYARDYYYANREKQIENGKRYNRTPQGKYQIQRQNAMRRGIEWKISFEEWLEWWGDEFDSRGYNLMMCRYNDKGPYQIGNVYKGTAADNAADRHA